MDLDNISDIELLKKLCKRHMVKMKKDYEHKDFWDEKIKYVFKKDHWYDVDQDEFGVNVYADSDTFASFSYEGAKEYLCVEGTQYFI